jgi:hypothetical protein
VNLPIQGPEKVWLRALLAGTDTVVLLCVNDDYSCDDRGTTISPVESVHVSVTVPAWLEPTEVFEVYSGGLQPANWDLSEGTVGIDVGTVDVSRLFVLTSDTQLKQQMARVYMNLSGRTLGAHWLAD